MNTQKLLSLSINGEPIPVPPGIKTGLPEDFNNIASLGISLLLLGAVFLALGYVVYGGIMWITSQGDKEKIASARKTITYALGGLILALLAFFIVNFFSAIVGFNLLNQTF